MKLPDKILISNVPYQINQVENLRGDDDQRLLGSAEFAKQQIQLDTNMQAETGAIVLLHEVIHIILEHGGFREQDEQLIDVLATGLFSFFMQNTNFIQQSRKDIQGSMTAAEMLLSAVENLG